MNQPETLTASWAMEEISAMIRNQEPFNEDDGSLVLYWMGLTIVVGDCAYAAADIEMGDDDLIIDVFPDATYDDRCPRRDYVQCVLDPARAVDLIDRITEPEPEGTDHTEWALQFALDQFDGCQMSAV